MLFGAEAAHLSAPGLCQQGLESFALLLRHQDSASILLHTLISCMSCRPAAGQCAQCNSSCQHSGAWSADWPQHAEPIRCNCSGSTQPWWPSVTCSGVTRCHSLPRCHSVTRYHCNDAVGPPQPNSIFGGFTIHSCLSGCQSGRYDLQSLLGVLPGYGLLREALCRYQQELALNSRSRSPH